MKITKNMLRRIIAEEVDNVLKGDQKTPDEGPCAACGGTGLRHGHGDTLSWRETPAMCDVCSGISRYVPEDDA